MTSKLLLAAAIAALSIGTAQAAPGTAGSVALEPTGIAAQEAKVKFYFGFGNPYYYQPYYGSPYYGSPYYYAPYPQYQGPYQYCHLGVCY